MTLILNAKPVREKIISQLKDRCNLLKEKGCTPTLKVILVGNDPASVVYTRNKKKFSESLGADCEIIKLSGTIKEEEFLAEINKYTSNASVHGVLIQLPLPKQLSHIETANLIPFEKDVDGFHPENIFRLIKNYPKNQYLQPCTPKGIMTLFDHYNIEVSGKVVTIIGRSMIVGNPMAIMLNNANATTILCHSKTKNLEELTKISDIVVCAIGKPKFINEKHINRSKNQIIVDVGINQDKNGKLCGDVDFENIANKVQAITPVPGGIGPLTILSLAENLLQAAENSAYK